MVSPRETVGSLFPAGAQRAVIDRDPGAKGPVTVRFKMPAGYRIPPHWHPTDEHITVLSGTLKAGGYVVAPANMQHYAWTATGATIQVHMTGPFGITYVNPADDPSKARSHSDLRRAGEGASPPAPASCPIHRSAGIERSDL
jgi:ChrR Cupin-like domain